MKRSAFKSKPCECGGMHSSLNCPQKPRATLRRASKPMKRESTKHRREREQTNREWFEANPPPIDDTFWICYISKHPQCPYYLTRETVVPEHDKSKARAPSERHNIKKIYPACTFDNEAKGSLSAEEYLAK
jgi:hypothetical protein